MNLSRRGMLWSALAAPVVITTPGLLMPVKVPARLKNTVWWPSGTITYTHLMPHEIMPGFYKVKFERLGEIAFVASRGV